KLAGPLCPTRQRRPARRLARRARLALRLEQALLLDDARRHFGEPEGAFAGGALQGAKRVLRGEAERRHEEPLRALDELPILERLLRAVDLRLQLLKLQ